MSSNVDDLLAELPTLETERLLLRKITPADESAIFAYGADPEVSKYMPWVPHQSLEDTRVYLASVFERYQKHTPGPWGIVHKGDAKLIGTCAYHDWQRNDRRAEIGYVLSRSYWGQGYMAEAVRALIAFGFRQMGLNRIQAMCDLPNIGSARVMEKVGMRFEGILREYFFEKGKYIDLKLYSILRSEWPDQVSHRSKSN
jgi:[ribosomal protein S5]-alanine N-acetyltransferase